MQDAEVEQGQEPANQEQGYHISTFEFVYDEKRSMKRCQLLSKCVFLLYYVTSTVADIQHVKQDHRFISYCVALTGLLISTCNMARYEYAFYKMYGQIFRSIEEFNFWKISQLPCLNYIFNALEFGLQIYFLCQSWPMNFDKFTAYEVSIGVLQLQTILLIIAYSLFAMLSCCIVLGSGFTVQVIPLSRRAVQVPPIPPIAPPNTLVSIIISGENFIDSGRECCICLDKNTNPWVTTRCSHSFHEECVSNWTRNNHSTCPVCRSNLFQTI